MANAPKTFHFFQNNLLQLILVNLRMLIPNLNVREKQKSKNNGEKTKGQKSKFVQFISFKYSTMQTWKGSYTFRITKASTGGPLQNICSIGIVQLEMATCSMKYRKIAPLEKSICSMGKIKPTSIFSLTWKFRSVLWEKSSLNCSSKYCLIFFYLAGKHISVLSSFFIFWFSVLQKIAS